MSATTVAAEPVREDASVGTAYKLLWLAVVFDLLAFGIGFSWDRQWHITHPFEDFFSPPHLFIYSMHLCATITLAYMAFSSGLRKWFGAAFTLPPLAFPVPGPIALAGAGFVLIALAGVFDSIWHTRFGLDETGWSFPHSMLGWGIFVAFLGVVSCRVALRQWRPIGWGSAIVFGFLIFATSFDRFAGPIADNISKETVFLVSRIPVLAAEPAFQHTTRIYLAAELYRANPLFVPLASLSAGMALALLRSFDARRLLTVGLTLLITRTSVFIPLIVPGLVLAARRSRPEGPWLWLFAGIGFAVTSALIWDGPPGSALLGIVLFMVGGALGDAIWMVVARPTRRGVLVLASAAGLLMPALTGIVDLSLRSRIP